MNTHLKENIDRYMDLKGIQYYSDLLRQIGKRMGKKGDDANAFVDQQKANFSKMLKGERPLNHDYYIPLEEIFGVPMAKLLNEGAYLGSVDEEDIPFLKGFRYYAHKDDLDLYDELDKMTTPEGDEIIFNSDEYNRFFIDYLIEYRSCNGIRYLARRRGFRCDESGNQYVCDGNMAIFASLPIEIAKLVIESDDPKLFDEIYDPFAADFPYPCTDNRCVYKEDAFLEALASSNKILASIFKERIYPFDELNKGVYPKDEIKEDIHILNPLVNLSLHYCLKHLDKHKKQARGILEFGKMYNLEALKKVTYPLDECRIDERGRLTYWNRPLLGVLVHADIDKVEDREIQDLILDLPSLEKGERL